MELICGRTTSSSLVPSPAGMVHERYTYSYAGRDFGLTDVHGRVVKEILGWGKFPQEQEIY